MADIFISYSRKDKSKVAPIGKALQDQGWSVFWDHVIPAGKIWDEVLEGELEIAKCVVVVWSINSVSSSWVRAEAEEGLKKNILVPVTIEDLKLPLLFRPIQAVLLTDWNEDSTHRQFKKLVLDLEFILGPSPLKTKQAHQKHSEEKETKKITDAGATQEEEQRLRNKEKETQRKDNVTELLAKSKFAQKGRKKVRLEKKQVKPETKHILDLEATLSPSPLKTKQAHRKRSKEKETKKIADAKAKQKEEQLLLSCWNPFDYLRVIWWVLFRRSLFIRYREGLKKMSGKMQLKRQTRWIANNLIWWPLLLWYCWPYFENFQGFDLLSSDFYICFVSVIVAWILTGLLGNIEGEGIGMASCLSVTIGVVFFVIYSGLNEFNVLVWVVFAASLLSHVFICSVLEEDEEDNFPIVFNSIISGVAIGVQSGVAIGLVYNLIYAWKSSWIGIAVGILSAVLVFFLSIFVMIFFAILVSLIYPRNLG